MTSWQKAIKYAAMAFAILLVLGIVSGIVKALIVISLLVGGGDNQAEAQTYVPANAVTELYIDIGAAELNIISADELRLEYAHSRLSVKEKDGRLTIKDSGGGIYLYNEASYVTLYLPEELGFTSVDISTGAGRVDIERLSCAKLNLDLGAGETVIGRLDVGMSADIDGGSGKLTVEDGSVWGLDLDMGVGKLEIHAELLGRSEIDLGIGEADITLVGSKDDYRIDLDKGIGDAEVDGTRHVGSHLLYGAGDNRVELDGGVGSIRVKFTAE